MAASAASEPPTAAPTAERVVDRAQPADRAQPVDRAQPADHAQPADRTPIERSDARRPAAAASIAPAATSERAPGPATDRDAWHVDEEVTTPHGILPAPAFDDLDDDTRVIPGTRGSSSEAERLLEAPRTLEDIPGLGDIGVETMKVDPPLGKTMQDATPWSIQAAEAPATTRKLDTLPALRVAVLGTGTPGEVRLVALGAGVAPPGSALAILVPITKTDAESIAKLFGSQV